MHSAFERANRTKCTSFFFRVCCCSLHSVLFNAIGLRKKKKWFQNQIESTVINCSVIFVVVVVRSRWLFASCLVHFAKYHNEHHAVAEYHAHKNVLPVFGFFFSFFLAVVVILLHLFVSQRHTAVYVMSDRANCFYCRPQTKRWKQNKTKNEYNNSIFGCNHNKEAKNGETQKKKQRRIR